MSIKSVLSGFVSKIIESKFIILALPAIIKNSKGEILLGKRSKTAPFYPSTWGLPGGIANHGETLNQAVKREIKEEIGVNSQVIKQGKPYNVLPSKESPIHSINIPMYCKIKGIPKAKDETSEVKWFKPKEIRKMNLAYKHKEILKQEKII